MEKYLNHTTDAVCAFQHLEIETAKVKQVLQYLEDEGTQHNCKINNHVRRYLKEHLNILYQVQAFLSFAVVEQYLTILQVVVKRNAAIETWCYTACILGEIHFAIVSGQEGRRMAIWLCRNS